MSTIAKVAKAALVLDQKWQNLYSKLHYKIGSFRYQQASVIAKQAEVNADADILQLERLRAARASLMIARHKQAMIQLHEGVDSAIEQVQHKKGQRVDRSVKRLVTAGKHRAASMRAVLAAEAALKAVEQLG